MTALTADDLDPTTNSTAELINNLGRTAREGRRDLSEQVGALTEHEDPLVREEALGALLLAFRDASQRWRAVSAVKEDTDFGVRAQAALSLSSVSTNATRDEDARLLIDRLLDEMEHLSTRRSAYDALLLLYGRREFPTRSRSLDLTREVDWAWIQMLREQLEIG
jgi:hypothetical protein